MSEKDMLTFLAQEEKNREELYMQLVEQHVINHNDPRFTVIDQAAFASKNLYNAALYKLRQAFIFQGKRLSFNTMDKLMQPHEAYKALPAKVAQQVLQQLDREWTSYFALSIVVKTKQPVVNQVRVVPRKGFYVVEVIYTKKEQQATVDPTLYAGIDVGVNNLAASISNKPGFRPVLVNGRPVKSCNQYYNKRRARLQKKLGKTGTTKRMERMTNKRNRRIAHYMHTASRQIIDPLIDEGIGTLVIGKNPEWKQEVNMGARNNQTFVQVPHARFIDMLSYKAQLVGIQVIITEESYTSNASFLDRDPLPTHDPDREEAPTFSGKRVKRGLYRASGKRYLNADVNGSYNIIRKVAPEIFEGVEDLVVHPVRITRTKQTKDRAL